EILDVDALEPLTRLGIRMLCKKTLAREHVGDAQARQQRLFDLVKRLGEGPVAVATDEANAQHYALPPEFFESVLGPNLKYSCAWWPAGTTTLADAERQMLDLYCERAQIVDGMRILDLGCGWGSFTVHAARRFPNSPITAVSNSRRQGDHIRRRLAAEGLTNVVHVTANVADGIPEGTFDRVVSIEMFEHFRNYRVLLQRVRERLAPDGALFVHVFCHRALAYLFDAKKPSDWMERYFFSGGVMPSADLLLYFASGYRIDGHWAVPGTHYQKTADAWWDNMRRNRRALTPILKEMYGKDHRRWWVYWKLFFLACAELFGYANGEEWRVDHYLFRRCELS
ncbi:MAG: class I SAM-dependent methyltransferase, partial [Proteobacteria bacterium]|nr:class I SAM-dependent methyltransferase [Pseudomonadota bacterium]